MVCLRPTGQCIIGAIDNQKDTAMTNCNNCNKELGGNFCSFCGNPKEVRRIDRQYIISEISDVLNFDKGIFYTIRELFVRPGDTVAKFIAGDRKRIVKPIIFLIVCSLIYTVLQQLLSFEAGYIKYSVEDETNTPVMVQLFQWFSKNFGYANILIAVFITFWIKLFFRRYDYNHYEIYILLCFVIGNSILIYSVLGIIEWITDLQILQLGFFVSLIYCTWAMGQFFDKGKKASYLKSFLSYILGMVTCLIVFFLIGSGLEILLK